MLWLNFGQLVALLVFLGWALYLIAGKGDWLNSARGWQMFGVVLVLGGAMVLIIGGFSANQLAVFSSLFGTTLGFLFGELTHIVSNRVSQNSPPPPPSSPPPVVPPQSHV